MAASSLLSSCVQKAQPYTMSPSTGPLPASSVHHQLSERREIDVRSRDADMSRCITYSQYAGLAEPLMLSLACNADGSAVHDCEQPLYWGSDQPVLLLISRKHTVYVSSKRSRVSRFCIGSQSPAWAA